MNFQDCWGLDPPVSYICFRVYVGIPLPIETETDANVILTKQAFFSLHVPSKGIVNVICIFRGAHVRSSRAGFTFSVLKLGKAFTFLVESIFFLVGHKTWLESSLQQ